MSSKRDERLWQRFNELRRVIRNEFTQGTMTQAECDNYLFEWIAAELARQDRDSRIDEVINAKIVHIDMPKEGIKETFDDWCFVRQEEINDGKPAKYGYDPTAIAEYRRGFKG